MKKIIAAAVWLLSAGFALAQTMSPESKLRYAERVIERYYVDTVNADHVVEEGIRAMLKTLDPHSQYSDKEETRELTEPLDGNFSGVGIQFNMLTDTLYIIQTVAGGPSEKVGILAGDRIIMVNDTVISGVKMKNTDVMKRLRGPKGTKVNVKVQRKGVDGLIDFVITRGDIPIYSVDASYMVDAHTGYLRVSRFAEKTAEEVADALKKLKKSGMKKLIIDLQDNTGGYLQAAVKVAEMFLDKNSLVVYTKGDKVKPFYYRTDHKGEYRDIDLVVLVNQYSASASEILAGAIQDNDRGVTVGRRTFGKGLVQRPFPFPDGTMIRLTIARYYTPSGRCIQKPYEDGADDSYNEDMMRRYRSGEFSSADSVHFADSLKCATLVNGRTVYGGGGIMPDRFVPIDTTFYSDYYRDLVAKAVVNKFTQEYIDANRKTIKRDYPTEKAFVAKFKVTQDMLDRIIELGEKDGVKFDEKQFETSRHTLETIVKALIGRDIFEQSTYYHVANGLNPVYVEGINIVNDSEGYRKLLGY